MDVADPAHGLPKRAKRSVVSSILVVIVIGLLPPAWAGGSPLHVGPRSWARQGSEIRLSGTFCNGSLAPVSAGPWFAYLDPPTTRPIFIGRVHIAPNTGNFCQWRLNASLTVPRVAPGAYPLRVCDLGCTQGVGDLFDAELTVVSSAPPRVEALRLQRIRAHLRRAIREGSRHEQMLSRLEDELGRAEAAIVATERRVERLRDRLSAEQRELPAWFGGVVASGLLAVATIALILWRRRRPRVVIPDTPAAMLEQESFDTVRR